MHAAGSTRWKVTLLGINFDINAGRSVEKHAVKCSILYSKVTCARTMEIYGKRSSTSPAAELSDVCSRLASRSAVKKGNQKVTTFTGSCLYQKNTDLYSYGLFVCFLFALFAYLVASLFFCLLTCWMFRGINKKQFGLNRDKVIDLIGRKLSRSQAEAY